MSNRKYMMQDQNNYYKQFNSSGNNNGSKMSAFFPLLFAVMLAIGVILGYSIQPGTSGSSGYAGNGKVNHILNLIESEYVDTVDRDDLIDKAIIGMLEKLDPHSVYMTSDEVKRSNEELSGQFGGIGVQFIIIDDTLMITHLVEGGPSFKKGLKPFDRILTANGKKFSGGKISNDDVFKTLRGEFGTKVNLEVYRPSDKKKLKFTVIRDAIPVPSIECAIMINSTTGLIRIAQFGQNTYSEFLAAARKLKVAGMKKLILDLRDNGGGYLQAAKSICDQFLADDAMIVFTKGVNQGREEYKATSAGEFENLQLTVLVNHNSASASEIVAGAIQDNDRGKIIGRRTFGKGLVQQQFGTFNDGSALRLTVSRYYTPSGRCIQRPYGNGIDYFHDGIERYENNEFYKPDSSFYKNAKKFYTINKKRVVYEGGGIMPDVFVPFDTSFNSKFYRAVLEKNLINAFAFRFVEQNRKTLSTMKSFQEFESKMNNNGALWNSFVTFCNNQKLTEKAELANPASVNWMKLLIRAEIARLQFNAPGYYYVRMNGDNEVHEALKAF